IDIDEKYGLMEEIGLDRIAKKKGIDLRVEVMKRTLFNKSEKDFKKKLNEEIYDEIFGKGKKE
ncbi:MAG: hypothetical protein KKD44_28840, partial [Proteobacteria bacterium]|nr:hypothetical protein [Pseudomonadota bacterium]